MHRPGVRELFTVLVTAMSWFAETRIQAAIHDPLAFGSLGTLSLTSGEWTIDTSNTPVIKDTLGGVLFTGSVLGQSVPAGAPFYGYNPDVAVFTFDSVEVASGATLKAIGDRPMVLLSRSGISIAGTIDANGRDGHNGTGNVGCDSDGVGGMGGPGGGKGGNGTGGNGEGPRGGAGGPNGISSRANGGGFGGNAGKGTGGTLEGSTYGDLHLALQGGSGGGASGSELFCRVGAGGGGGGGGLELGAVTSITLNHGLVAANGGKWGGGGTVLAGGGSGGGIIPHAPLILGTAGNVQAGGSGPPGNAGAGGGGRILVYTNAGTRPDGITFSAPGGGDNTPNGVVEFEKLGLVAGDLNGDHNVDAADAALMFANWGLAGAGDLNGDGIVDAADAGEMFANWTGDAAPPVNAVPEPTSSIALFAVVALRFLAGRSRKQGSLT